MDWIRNNELALAQAQAGGEVLYGVQDAEAGSGRGVSADAGGIAAALDLQRMLGAPELKREVSVRRQAVLDLIKRLEIPLTTKEMARVLMAKEVSVRAAVIWLELGGYIIKRGSTVRHYPNRTYTKRVARYVWTGRTDPICQVRVKDVDEPERERMNKRYGDGGVELQRLMMGLRKKVVS